MNTPIARILAVIILTASVSGRTETATVPAGDQPRAEPGSSVGVVPAQPALRGELLAMRVEDQRVRKNVGPAMTSQEKEEWRQVDTRNEKRMMAIIAEHGWPGKSLVGTDGAHAAWLLVQHCSRTFQEECLPLLEKAVAQQEATGKDYAYLLDRVLMHRGKPQVYGTQFRTMDGTTLVHPIEDPDHLDERRRSVGLGPWADYEKNMTANNKTSNQGSIIQGLRTELLTMAAENQRMMQKSTLPESPQQAEEYRLIKARHAIRTKEIIAQNGWPGFSRVGADGAFSMWLLVQNSGDSKFMEECLPLMERAVAAKEAAERNYAYLLDAVRMAQGRPQVYGTQFIVGDDGMLAPYQIEDRERVDELRRTIGLDSLEEYVKQARARQR